MGRSKKCVTTSQKVMPHPEFIDRIRKSLYFGGDALTEEMEVSRPLAEYASEIFSEPHKGHSLNRLNYVAAGSVHASPCSLIMALIYLDRLNITDPGYARRITPQELFIVSMMISTKFYAGHDEDIYISDWADDGNMTEDRLKQLELEFLSAIDWNIYISNEHFFNKLTNIEKTLARREGLRRGWLTYSELIQMLPSFALAKFLLNNITVMVVSYAASVMTIAGAFFLASNIPGNALYRKTVLSDGGANNVNITSETVMPAIPTQQRRNCSAKALDVEVEEERSTCATPVTIALNMNSCDALNVELELLKLERQYREEALRDEHRKRNNEVKRLTLQAYNEKESRIRNTHDMQRNWLALKDEYSEKRQRLFSATTATQHCGRHRQEENRNIPCFADCIWNLNNCTASIFWQLLANTAQQSILRVPFLWFKFI